ncbi:MAG: hypothetical protein KUF79_00845 [Candidatus Thiodiazotropha sp. (ex Ctena orbiculata)]|nr:hypothetical protein [Candidatus Thiodiazotropha taylori]
MIKKILYSIVGALVICTIITICAISLNVAYDWISALDAVLNTSLFATLAGLALAAAAFLISLGEIQKEKGILAKREKDNLWSKLDQQKSTEITNWENKNKPITISKIEDEKNLNDDQKNYMQEKLNIRRYENLVVNIRSGREYLIYSFFVFVIGLGVTLTLDLAADASIFDQCSEPDTVKGLYDLVVSASKYTLAFADVSLSVGAITCGVWLLWAGAWNLLKYGKA